MEALVVVGLVSNVVQFVDFAGELVSKTHEIYTSVDGLSKDHADIEHLAEKTRVLAEALKQSHPSADPELLQLCTECSRIADELLDALTKSQVQGKHTRFKSARQALKSVWSKEKISKMQNTLSAFRDQLNLHIWLQLRAFYTVDGSSPVVQAIRAADYVKFRQLLIDRKATPFDTIEEHGKRAGSLFSSVVEQFPYFQDMVGEAGKTTALLQMAQLLVASGVDCDGSHSLLLLARPKIPKRSDLDDIMTRMVLENSKDDPLSYVHMMTNVNRNWKAAILGQEHWDTTEAETKYDGYNGEGAWQRLMVEGLDALSWLLEQTAAWKREPRRVRHSRTASQTKYGFNFCHSWKADTDVCQWLRLRWRELRPSVRHSLQACEKELEVQDFAEQFERLCDEERWEKEPAEVKLSREETEKKYGRDFVQTSLPSYFMGWYSQWEYLTREEELLPEDWTGSEYSEDSIEDYDKNAENSDEGSDDSDGGPSLVDADSVDDSSHDSEYETADED